MNALWRAPPPTRTDSVVTGEARLQRIMARHDPHMHPGAFVTCVYDPDRALCRPHSGPGSGPELTGCQPPARRNIALPLGSAPVQGASRGRQEEPSRRRAEPVPRDDAAFRDDVYGRVATGVRRRSS